MQTIQLLYRVEIDIINKEFTIILSLLHRRVTTTAPPSPLPITTNSTKS